MAYMMFWPIIIITLVTVMVVVVLLIADLLINYRKKLLRPMSWLEKALVFVLPLILSGWVLTGFTVWEISNRLEKFPEIMTRAVKPGGEIVTGQGPWDPVEKAPPSDVERRLAYVQSGFRLQMTTMLLVCIYGFVKWWELFSRLRRKPQVSAAA